MSRRFGRNQKRRMREALVRQQQVTANRQEVIDQSVLQIERLRQHINHQSSIIEHVKEVLGRHFVALEAQDVKMEILPRIFRWPRYTDIRTAFSLMGEDAMSEVLEDMMLYPIETKLGELREEVVVRVVTPCGDAAMYVSQDALMRMSDDRLRRTLTQEVADQLAMFIVKMRKQGDQSRWPPRNY